MKYVITLNGKKYEVEVEKGQATAVYAGEAQPMSAAPAPAAPVAPAASAAPAPAPAASALVGAGEPVASPMPGTILDVKCSVGQAVKSGEILFILEAMKMENEITAPKDGKVTAVCVAKSSTVETGTVLCTLE